MGVTKTNYTWLLNNFIKVSWLSNLGGPTPTCTTEHINYVHKKNKNLEQKGCGKKCPSRSDLGSLKKSALKAFKPYRIE